MLPGGHLSSGELCHPLRPPAVGDSKGGRATHSTSSPHHPSRSGIWRGGLGQQQAEQARRDSWQKALSASLQALSATCATYLSAWQAPPLGHSSSAMNRGKREEIWKEERKEGKEEGRRNNLLYHMNLCLSEKPGRYHGHRHHRQFGVPSCKTHCTL